MNTFGDRIRELRQSKNLTQEEFGKLFGIVKSTVSLYESNKSTPDDTIKMNICQYFNVSMDYLFGMSTDKLSGNLLFSEILKKLRIKYRLSQEELATVLGYSRTAISAYELGRNEPSFKDLKKIAEHFNVSTDYLIGVKKNNNFDSDLTEYDNLKKFLQDPQLRKVFEKLIQLTPEQRAEADSYLQYLADKNKK